MATDINSIIGKPEAPSVQISYPEGQAPYSVTTDPVIKEETSRRIASNKAKMVNGRGSSRYSKASDLPADGEWVNTAFLLPDTAFDDVFYRQNRYATSADMKFGDTRPGGSIGINSRPQFTPAADPRRKGRLRNFQKTLRVNSFDDGERGYGYGRIWSEAHDDPQQKIYMRFGVPEFNPIANFIRRAFTYEEIVIARRGRTPSWLFTVGQMAGAAVWMTTFPVVTMGYLFFKGLDFFLSRPANKYYSFKSAMHYYWSMVQTIVNTVMVNRGVMPRVLKNKLGGNNTQVVGRPYVVNSDMLDYYSALFPEFFNTEVVGGVEVVKYFDCFAIATRAQRLANQFFVAEYNYLEGQGDVTDPSSFKGYVNKREEFVANYLNQGEQKPSLLTWFRRITMAGSYWAENSDPNTLMNSAEQDIRASSTHRMASSSGLDLEKKDTVATGGAAAVTQQQIDSVKTDTVPDMSSATAQEANVEKMRNIKARTDSAVSNMGSTVNGAVQSALSDSNYLAGQITDTEARDSSVIQQFLDNMDAEFRDGSGFAVFCVDYTGSISESFSNSYGESELSNKLNSASATAKEFRFTIGDGNLLGDSVQGLINAVGDLAFGLADSVTLGMSNLLLGIAGSGFIDIPKHWQDSSANLPRSTYTTTFISPYHNVFSDVPNIILPMAMGLAAAVPRSIGRSSYAGPFICQLFDRGRNQIQLGAITSMTFTRGTSNLGYSLDGKALAIEMSFEVTDLSSIMHMPMGSGSILDGLSALGLDDDSVASNYLAVLAGQDMYSQVYAIPRAITRAAKLSSSLGKIGSGYYWSSLMHEKLTNGGGLFLLTRPLARFYEMLQVGTNVISGTTNPAGGG